MRDNKNSPWLPRGLLCLAVVIAYASVWPNQFVFDDMNLIVWNDFLKHWSNLPQLLTSRSFTGGGIPGGFYRPVQMLVYFFIYQAFGPSTIAFHALNISLQALNACLLHHFGRRAGFKKGAAFAAALLWAAHPLHTTDVAYMASTAELLWSCFSLLGLIALLPDFSPRKIACAMIFFALALCGKETAVVFPALACITFFFVSKERSRIAAYVRFWPLWALAALYTAIRLWFMPHSVSDISPFADRMLTSFATLPAYARLIVWPAGLRFEQSFPVYATLRAGLPLTGALLAALGLLQIFKGKARALSFGILWFAVALAPYTGIVVPVNAPMSEGWLYMPTMGLFLGAAQTAAGFFEKKKNTARLLAGALALALGLTTFLQNETWRSTDTLYQSIPQDEEYTSRLSLFLGPFYMRQGEFDKAAEHFRHEIVHADGYPKIMQADFHWMLAMALLHAPQDKNGNFTMDMHTLQTCQHMPDVIAELGKTLQDNPDYYWAHQVLAVIYRSQGDTQMADFHDRKVKEILQKQADEGR